MVDPAGVVEGAASRGDPVVRRVLELFHLTLQMALPALGSVGLLLVYGDALIGKLFLLGWLPIVVFLLADFAFHQPPRTTAAALLRALAVPAELALTHALFGDTPLLFFVDLFLLELVAMLVALVVAMFVVLVQEGFDREKIAAFIVLSSIGVPMLWWVVLPFWLGRSDDPQFLLGLGLGVILAGASRVVAIGAGPVGGDEFATPWMVRGLVLWVVAIFVTFYAL